VKILILGCGLASLCLLQLGGCASDRLPLERPTIVTGCPAVVPCYLPPASPTNNGELLTDQERTEAAWAECAAQVDMIYNHQQPRADP
jgi:hypothetical protein